MKLIKVAAALILKKDKILIARRRKDISNGGNWEFPGGKIRPGENSFSAIIREIKEEFGMKVEPLEISGQIITELTSDLKIELTGVLCRTVSGILYKTDHDKVEWVSVESDIFCRLGKPDQLLLKKIYPSITGKEFMENLDD